MITRRLVLPGLLAAAAAAAVPRSALAAVRGATATRIDVGPLLASGLGPIALRIKAALERELAAALPPGRIVAVRVLGLTMASYVGGTSGGTGGGGGGNDTLESETTVIGAGGRVLPTIPILSVSPASLSGPWYDPASDGRRIEALAKTHAAWIVRGVGG